MSNQPKPPARAGLGRHVVVELVLDGESERLEFDIVPDEQADFEAGFLGHGTPLARAIEGLAAGQAAPYRAGGGGLVRVLSVEPARSGPPADVARRRAETLRKAVDQSDRTNAMMFASSFSGKWGDYDPSALDPVDKSGDEPHSGGERSESPGDK
jgi:hypothetical protein